MKKARKSYLWGGNVIIFIYKNIYLYIIYIYKKKEKEKIKDTRENILRELFEKRGENFGATANYE